MSELRCELSLYSGLEIKKASVLLERILESREINRLSLYYWLLLLLLLIIIIIIILQSTDMF